MLSQIKISKQTAPAIPPTCVIEKKTKKPPPNSRHTHGCAAGRTRRKRIAAGIRNNKKYAKVLKIMYDRARAYADDGHGNWSAWEWGEYLKEGRTRTHLSGARTFQSAATRESPKV